ncbi:MAG: hypothetical protein KDD38_11735, partial [Bdellovibrionales bacterium]|nr:hypothetical protein [Bdellovibrionales bacterium]
ADALIEAKFIPRDCKQAKLIVTSKSDEPLTVRLPRTFAGVPVPAQGGFGGPGGGAGGFGAGGGRGGAGNNQQGGGQNQGMGGMMGGGMMGGGMGGMGMGGGMGGGMFNIAPEKTVRMEAHCVCLEHGKEEPRPKVPYEIRPIDEFTDNADVQELLNLFATGQVNQRVVQAAAWHLANNMSWAELAAKQIEHVGR